MATSAAAAAPEPACGYPAAPTISSSISGTLSAVSGLAMESGTGNDRLENTGIVVGNLILGGGINSVFNAEGATFMTIDTLDLQEGAGSSGTFTNEGDLLLGRSAPRYPIDLLAGDDMGFDGRQACRRRRSSRRSTSISAPT